MKKAGKAFGAIVPIVVDDTGIIHANSVWYHIALAAGLKEVPTISAGDLTAEQKKALLIAEARVGELGKWDKASLAQQLKYLKDSFPTFDLEATGFTIEEVDIKIEPLILNTCAEPPLQGPSPQIVSKVGDVWSLGDHTLICGSALDPGALKTLIADKTADAVFTDPPYNCEIDGHARGNGKRFDEFPMASGELSSTQFTEFLETAFRNLKSHLRDGALLYSFMDWRGAANISAATKSHYSQLNLCVWVKPNGGMGSFYRSRHELVFVLKNGTGRHCNNIELGRHGRYRTNVWEYESPSHISNGKGDLLANVHPTMKPIGLICDALQDSTKRGDVVLDPFIGSGQTLLAAEKTVEFVLGSSSILNMSTSAFDVGKS